MRVDTGGKDGQRNKREGGRMLEDMKKALLRQSEDEVMVRKAELA